MKQALLDKHNNVLSISQALAWQIILKEQIYLGQINDDDTASKRKVWISNDYKIHLKDY